MSSGHMLVYSQEHVFQDLLSSHGNKDRGVTTHTECGLSSEYLTPPPRDKK